MLGSTGQLFNEMTTKRRKMMTALYARASAYLSRYRYKAQHRTPAPASVLLRPVRQLQRAVAAVRAFVADVREGDVWGQAQTAKDQARQESELTNWLEEARGRRTKAYMGSNPYSAGARNRATFLVYAGAGGSRYRGFHRPDTWRGLQRATKGLQARVTAVFDLVSAEPERTDTRTKLRRLSSPARRS